jgi:hypothetical protein
MRHAKQLTDEWTASLPLADCGRQLEIQIAVPPEPPKLQDDPPNSPPGFRTWSAPPVPAFSGSVLSTVPAPEEPGNPPKPKPMLSRPPLGVPVKFGLPMAPLAPALLAPDALAIAPPAPLPPGLLPPAPPLDVRPPLAAPAPPAPALAGPLAPPTPAVPLCPTGPLPPSSLEQPSSIELPIIENKHKPIIAAVEVMLVVSLPVGVSLNSESTQIV